MKDGDKSKAESLNMVLRDFKTTEHAESFLHELGQLFLCIGIEEIFKYTNSKDFKFIAQLSKEEWEGFASEKNCDLPVHLANKMINYFKDKQLCEKLTLKWDKSRGEIEKHVMPMARYITEGLIDVLE